MSDIIRYEDKLIGIGYFVEINEYGSDRGLGPVGDLSMIERMKRTKRGENFITVRSIKRNKLWPGVEGLLNTEYGIEFEIHEFVKLFSVVRTHVVVNEYKFNNRMLDNISGLLIGFILDHRNKNISAMIEFDFIIECAGCADGLGKYGQCLSIPTKFLEFYVQGKKYPIEKILSMSQKNELDRFNHVEMAHFDEFGEDVFAIEEPIALNNTRPF